MSVIQSQCVVACRTMPLHRKFPTIASLEGGDWGDWGDWGDGLDDMDGYSVSSSITIFCSTRDFMSIIRFIMRLGASVAVVGHSAAAAHITSRRYNTL